MGRGRKGVLDQSKKTKAQGGLRGRRGFIDCHFLTGQKREEKKLLIEEDALESMKNMDQQQLVDFFLPNDDWHVKTSAANASGN